MTQTSEINIRGMYCSACSSRIEKVVSKIDGVTDISVNLTTETGRVTYSRSKTCMKDIIERINKIGFQATNAKNKDHINKLRVNEVKEIQRKFIISVLLTTPLAWAMLAHFKWASFIPIPLIFLNPYFQFLLAFPIQFIIGYTFYERSWQAIKNGSINMDVLVVLSTSAAFFYSHFLTFLSSFTIYTTDNLILYYETSAFIITFILLGRLLETKTKWKTTEALEKLYDFKQQQATVLIKNEEILTDVSNIDRGQTVIIKPGEKVPVDGQVIEGYSLVNESLLTGESIPVEKKQASAVYAGTINENGLLKVTVLKKDSETTLSKIIEIVKDAQTSKAPIQEFANKIASIFVPIILLISIVTFLISYYFIEPAVFDSALVKVIAVLIVACPCAIGLAAPTSMMVGSGRAAQHGVLFKQGKYLELLGNCDVLCLDKTGTITSGVPKVNHLSFTKQFNTQQVIDAIVAIEKHSNHPIAKAIVHNFSKSVRPNSQVKNITNMPGYGIKAIVNNQSVVIASPTYFFENNLFIPQQLTKQIHSLEDKGDSIAIVTIDSAIAALISLSDEVKLTSIKAVKQLKNMGLKIFLLTGDHKKVAIDVSKKVSINDVYSQCTPVEKSNIVKELIHNGHSVAMVGDGINDAPALSVADVGVAIGTGADIAVESGDVTILNNDLTRLVDAIKISQKTILNIKQNFAWAFVYNIIMIPLAMFGILLPWLAAAAMAFSSIAVVLNSLRLKRIPLY